MGSKKIGFATSAKYRDLTVGDILTVAELRKRGYEVEPLVWSEEPPHRVTCDVVVLRSVWDYHLDPERFLNWVTTVAQRAIIFNHPDTVRWNSYKRYIFDLQQAGIPVPSTTLVEAGGNVDLAKSLLQLRSPKAVIKPAISASAYETYLVDLDNASTMQARISELLLSRAMLIQEFVPEISTRGEWSLMFLGGAYSHAVRKIPQSGDFRVQSEHGGIHLPENPPVAVLELAERTVNHFAADSLYARVDLVEASSRPLIMEVELIDPELFLATASNAASRLADTLLRMFETKKERVSAP
jgi:glutathione synthase/RimK-type ligase-like ATP-grasp enzyme